MIEPSWNQQKLRLAVFVQDKRTGVVHQAADLPWLDLGLRFVCEFHFQDRRRNSLRSKFPNPGIQPMSMHHLFRSLVVLGLTFWFAVVFAEVSRHTIPRTGEDRSSPRVPRRHAMGQFATADNGQAPWQGRTGPLLDQRVL